MSEEKREIKFKNPFMYYLLSILTLGIYSCVWMIKSKRDLVSLGAEIPTSWLLLVPFASLYWSFKWIAGYCKLTNNDNALIMFIGAVLFPPFALLLPYMIQSAINEHAPSPIEPTEQIAA